MFEVIYYFKIEKVPLYNNQIQAYDFSSYSTI